MPQFLTPGQYVVIQSLWRAPATSHEVQATLADAGLLARTSPAFYQIMARLLDRGYVRKLAKRGPRGLVSYSATALGRKMGSNTREFFAEWG